MSTAYKQLMKLRRCLSYDLTAVESQAQNSFHALLISILRVYAMWTYWPWRDFH